VPNGAWLHAGIPSAGQQSWNLAFCPTVAAGHYTLREQDRLVIDGRLNPP
jgi:hypothetical protein